MKNKNKSIVTKVEDLPLEDLYINWLVLDINDRNKVLAPAKEMTIDEIEKELGYKIKIVKEEEKNDTRRENSFI